MLGFRCARCGPQAEGDTDPLSGAIHAVQGLLAGERLCVQKEPLGGTAAPEDFGERAAFQVVAGRTTTVYGPVAGTLERQLLDPTCPTDRRHRGGASTRCWGNLSAALTG
jgi:hypothetical protein